MIAIDQTHLIAWLDEQDARYNAILDDYERVEPIGKEGDAAWDVGFHAAIRAVRQQLHGPPRTLSEILAPHTPNP